MVRIVIAALFLIAQTGTAWAAATCAGADPTIAGVAVKGMTTSGKLNHYELSGTVTNTGSAGQANDTLQFVNIYDVSGVKLDAKAIPPLAAGQSSTFSYIFDRSTDAGNGTTKLTFQLGVTNPTPPGSQDCNPDNDKFTLSF